MKVLLIQPPFTILKTEIKKCHPPLGIAYLAAVLKEKHDITILDALAEGYYKNEFLNKEFIRYGLPFRDIKRIIERLKPDVVGVSCLFSAQSKNVHKICRIVKEINRKIITVLGGAHPSAVPGEVFRDYNVDFVIIGEGESTLPQLLECIEYKKDIQEQDMDGVAYRHNGCIKVSQKKKYQENLDSFPFPYWDILPLERYFEINNPHGSPVKNTPFLPMVTSRGCPFECIFCSIHNLWGRSYRKRSTSNVLMELEYIGKKFGIKEVLFEDDSLTFDKGRAKEIFRGMIDKKININWTVPNGIAVQTLDDEMLELMKASGCYGISVGIESGDEDVLKAVIKKPITLRLVGPVIRKAKELGLETTVFFVIGFPGETRAQLKNTFRFAESLYADNTNFFFATPLPGTRLLNLCKEKGLIGDDIDYARLKSNYPVFSTEYFSIKKLNYLIRLERLKIAFLYFFKNPKKFIGKVYRKLLNNPKYFLRLVNLHLV